MTVHIGVSGAHKAVSAIHVGVGGVWKQVQSGWIGVGGVWKQFFNSVTAQIADQTASSTVTGGTATAQFRLVSDGTIAKTTGNNTVNTTGTWLASGSASGFEVRATYSSGEATSSGTIGSWESLGSNRTWARSAGVANGPHTAVILIEIRRASDAVVVDSALITLTAERDA